ncbi:MAG: PhzF family phenazine biosynthesis protein, partial [Candidatus Izemoplasmataceae bacterium]
VHRVSAFTYKNQGGNEAGVVLDASSLNSPSMQHVAKTIGYSETAFITGIQEGLIEVRYFTPSNEVPLCGHATIGLLNLLRLKGIMPLGTVNLKTLAGLFPVKIEASKATLIFPKPSILETHAPTLVTDRFPLNASDLSSLPIVTIDAGVKELYVGLKKETTLRSLEPDGRELCDLSETHGVSGIVFYTAEAPGALAIIRNFLPLIGIQEESATGTAAAALSSLLYTHQGPFEKGVIHQGESLGKPSRIDVRIQDGDASIDTIEISGQFRVIDTVDVTL